jgi:tetratricopeptide (TPR) repeat protein
MPPTNVTTRILQCVIGFSFFAAVTGYSQPTNDPLAEQRALLAEGKLAASDAALHSYLKDHPTSAEAHFLLGYVLFREQKTEDSLAEFTAGARIRRPKADEFKAIASDYVLLGDFADADKWFTEVIVEKPDDADAWYLLGRTKYNENSFTAAVSSFERSLALRPRNVEAENNLGLAWQGMNSPDKAKEAFQTAIDWQGAAPTDPQPFLNLGTMLAEEPDFERAMPLLLKAAELSPDNPKAHEELGHVYEAQQNLPKAQTELERAVALAPDTSALHFKLGQVYRREGMHDRAQQEFDLCEKLNSTHSSTSTPNPLKPTQSAPQ